jgi:hypothetical protein
MGFASGGEYIENKKSQTAEAIWQENRSIRKTGESRHPDLTPEFWF